MNKLLEAAQNDLRITFHENGIWINLVLIPAVLIFVIGLVNGAFVDEGDPVTIVDVINADLTDDGTPTALSESLLQTLRQSGGSLILCPMDNDRFSGDICELGEDATLDLEVAQDRVQDGIAVGIIEIPMGFEADVLAGQPVSINYRSDDDPLQPGPTVQTVQAAVQRVAGAAAAGDIGREVLPELDADADASAFGREVYEQATVVWSNLPQTVLYRLSTDAERTVSIEAAQTNVTYAPVDAGQDASGTDGLLRVDLIDLDDTAESGRFAGQLALSGLLVCTANTERESCLLPAEMAAPFSADLAAERLASGITAATITIPEGFRRSLRGGDAVTVTLVMAENVSLESVVQNALARTEPETDTADGGGFRQSVPGIGSMYVMFTVLAGAQILLRERNQWTLQRLVTMPVSRVQLLGGKMLARFVMGMIQYLVAFGIGFALGVDFGNSPESLLLVMMAFSICMTGVAFMIATFVQNEEQAAIFVTFIALTTAPLGGAWWPLEIVPPFMQTVAYITPIAWAMRGFTEVIFYGGGLVDVLLPVGVLLAMTAVFFAVAVSRFQVDA